MTTCQESGKRGGSSKSEAKAKAARENGKKGGRPIGVQGLKRQIIDLMLQEAQADSGQVFRMRIPSDHKLNVNMKEDHIPALIGRGWTIDIKSMIDPKSGNSYVYYVFTRPMRRRY